MRLFRKHPNYIGKYMTLYSCGADRTVQDGDVLEGDKWAKYVSEGMLVEIENIPIAPEPVPALASAPPREPVREPVREPEKVDGDEQKSELEPEEKPAGGRFGRKRR